jgi:hypothetical protein
MHFPKKILCFGEKGIYMSWGQSNVNTAVCYCHQEGSEPVLHFSCWAAKEALLPMLAKSASVFSLSYLLCTLSLDTGNGMITLDEIGNKI